MSRSRRFIFLIVTALIAIVGMWSASAFAANSSKTSKAPAAADIARDPSDLPPPIVDRAPAVVHVKLVAREMIGQLDGEAGTTYRYWTFNGKVPGPFVRVRQGDTVEITLQNDKSDMMVHSIDLHAALGPGGGSALSQVPPGQTKTFSFQATTPGLYVYHCGTAMVAVSRMAQSANDRCKDDLIGERRVNYVRRFKQEAQGNETKIGM